MFKHQRYPKAIILQAVYFKLRFTLSYRDIEELFQIRGVKVDHSTIQRWVFKFSPIIEKNMHKRKQSVGGWMKPILKWVARIDTYIVLLIRKEIQLIFF
jgi:transposase-like protein